MILGMTIQAFTLLHVIISLVGIASGLVVAYAMLTSRRVSGWTGLFLASTILTSVTGFMFPRTGFTPAQAVGAISLAVLAVALLALYVFNLKGHWRWIYVASALAALWLNSFVGVVQSFQKIAFLHPLAPNGSEPPFIVAQVGLVLVFVVLGVLGVRKFYPE